MEKKKGKTVAVKDMGLWRITWPFFIDIFLVFLISFMDIFFLSRVSDSAAAALGGASAYSFFLYYPF